MFNEPDRRSQKKRVQGVRPPRARQETIRRSRLEVLKYKSSVQTKETITVDNIPKTLTDMRVFISTATEWS